MWIVRVALDRPYTFVVLALLILILSPVVILRTPTDIFPSINIPVIAVAWQYTGLNPEEMEGRLTSVYERILTTTVDNIEHIESTTVNGQAIIKIFLQPTASLDTANAQVTAVSQTILRQLPPGALPPLIINYSASSVPILQLALSGKGLSEQQLNDMGQNFLRPQLVTVPGAVIPWPYGGKQRQVMIDLNQDLLQAKGLSPQDVLNALTNQNLVLPAGTAKIDEFEYDVRVNSSPRTVAELNDLPIKQVGSSTIYLRDVANVRDGFAPQTNIVRQDGHRGVLLSVLKAGTASTISVVQGIRDLLPRVAQTLPPELKIQPLADQSVFVKSAVSGVIREAVIAACLTALMILLFLGSWRSTLIIAISIPLSILTSVIVLSLLGQTINIMTLGGLALAVGILVDDATVEIENIERNLAQGKEIKRAILDGASQIAVPAFVSTLCICIVFLPMFFLTGVSKYLFVPLAEAVVFAMLASYFLSRTLVPTLAMYLLRSGEHGPAQGALFSRVQKGFERGFDRLRLSYQLLLTSAVHRRRSFIPVFLLVCLSMFLLVPWLGQNFFPDSENGQFLLHIRAQSGTRIEETARTCDLVEASIRRQIPVAEVNNILDNIGLPYSTINYMHATSGLIGAADADILVSLNQKHRPVASYVRELRKTLPRDFPGVTFYFLPADIVTQVLNFGLPAPIDIQIDGNDIEGNRQVAEQILAQLRHVPGLTDLRIQQQFDYPTYDINVDRTKAVQGGLTERSVATSVLNSLSGSFQITPMFFLNWKNGVNYNLVAQTPQYKVQSLEDLENTPVTTPDGSHSGILADVATVKRSSETEAISHYNIRRIVEIYGSVQDRDLGSVARDIDRVVDANRKSLPRGSFITIRGQIQTMRSSYVGLLAGLGFSIMLVYLLIVVNFQSWLDPFIIITALPAALAGIVVFLFITRTTLSVPALMGAIMCMGVATANSILVVSFAKERLLHTGDAIEAAIEAGYTRFRPVVMTALAMIIGMVPMAMGLGDGGEQNAPLGRAVIGGLLFATVATLIFVPSVFSVMHRGRSEELQSESNKVASSVRRENQAMSDYSVRESVETSAMKVSEAVTDTKTTGPVVAETHPSETNIVPANLVKAGPKQASVRTLPRSLALFLAAAAMALAVVVVFGIHSRVAAAGRLARTTNEAAIPSVNVVHPQSSSRAQDLVLPGNTQAFIDSPIYARTNGYLKRWYIDIGARVRQGQLLAEIETPELDQQLRQARAELATAEANLNLSQITAERDQNLLKTHSVSTQERDNAVNAYAANKATVDSNQANVARLEQLQSFEKVYAPFDGVITARSTDVGALIDAGANAPKELFHIAAIGKLRVYVAVPEVYSRVAIAGAPADLTADEYPGETFHGILVRNSNAIDASSRTLLVEVDVDNSSDRLKPGAYFQVHFQLPADAHSLTVPSSALIFRRQGLQVAVVRDGKANLVPVTPGRDYGDTMEILAGLRPDDDVILSPSDSLMSGTPVQVASSTAGGVRE